jgi:Fe-S oxidoreductase
MDKKIAYFAGCTHNYIEPEVGYATVQVLEKNGLRPVFPAQECCSLPLLFYGNLRSFLRHAHANVKSLAGEDCDIVTSCTSCALVLKRDYPRVLKSAEAAAVASRTYDIMEYLSILNANHCLNTMFSPIKLKLAYHAPCHLKVFGQIAITNRLNLFKSVSGLSVTRVERGCCGMAGTFGLKKSNYQLSMAIGRALFEELRRLAPDMVITDCPGCKMQISQGAGLPVSHPILVLKESFRI